MVRFSGEVVARRRHELNMRPEAVAVGIGKSAASVRFYENGTVDPPASVVARLAMVLQVAAGDLFVENEDAAA